MNVAFCYESVLPYRGGCETYISGLARRLAGDGHAVHLYACRWDAQSLPGTLHYHRVSLPPCPRFLRPWVFGAACRRALRGADHQVTVGFDKLSGLDVLYPQGGLYLATAEHNLLKYRSPLLRRLAGLLKKLDPAHQSFCALERRQYRPGRTLVVAISDMVRRHFQYYYGLPADNLRLVRLAANADRFDERDRPRRRLEWRQQWGFAPQDVVALFAGINYRLKGLEPLLRAVARLPAPTPFRLLVAGGRETAPFERLARRLGVADRVRFIGYCTDMRNCYFAADFFVHPTFYDPCSHVVLEAMACGLPVITTRYNGASELMRPPREGDVIDDPHDHARLADCLARMLDPARRSACAQAARRAAAGWTFEHHYRQMLAVFAEAAARKRAA
ncbi:MAG TPA: glycosyltransferase family 4 protein [Gemmataceae bacterium]|nr:glycosyltransferase family 4 protein [Gemmataceae bacterium]